MARILLVIVILLALVLALFGVQNPQPVNIRFMNIESGRVPLYVVILVSTLAGVLLASILGLRSRISNQMRMRKQNKHIADLEKQIKELREQPRSLVLDAPEPQPTSAGTQTPERVTGSRGL